MQEQSCESASASIKRREGLGFLVEELLSDFKNDDHHDDDNVNKCEEEWNECNNDAYEKKYDEIKKSIIEIYKKINQRKNYNHKMYNVDDKTDVAFSYINYSKVREQYRELLKLLYAEKENNKTKCRAKWHIAMLCRLLAHARDISGGCGERELSYMQLFELARVDAACANCALKAIVLSQSHANANALHPIGSWKDIKGLVAYMRRTMNMRDERDMSAYLELTKYAAKLVNERLAKDVLAFYKDADENDNVDNGANNDDDNEVSFVSKWIPRENKSKKYGNFYERLACDYYKDWLPKDRNANPVSYEKAIIKCKIHYRKLVSFLNQYLETPQVKMCQRRWSDIAFSKTTRLTRDLQDRALLNLKPDDHRVKRRTGDSDRDACAEKYKVWKCETINRQNGINTDLETHVRVSEYYGTCSSLAVNRNAEWAAFASQEALKSRLSRVIPVLAGCSYKAVGLALAVAENAATGRTLIVKDGEELVLHDLDASFVKNVNGLRKKMRKQQQNQNQSQNQNNSVCNHPMYKCLVSALKLLVESNIEAKQTRHGEKSGFTITIFADDDSSEFFNDDVYVCFKEIWNEISFLYREFGYGVPNVVIWTMASTVCQENHINNDNNYNIYNNDYNIDNNIDNNNNNDNASKYETVAYSSVSHDGALTIRVGCDANDICTYLGVSNKQEKCRVTEWHNKHQNWQTEWNNLVEVLYNQRYYKFEQCFWKI